MTVEEHLIFDLHRFFEGYVKHMSYVDVDGVGEVGGDSIDAHILWILTTRALGIADKNTTYNLGQKIIRRNEVKRRLCCASPCAMSTVGFPPVILCDEP